VVPNELAAGRKHPLHSGDAQHVAHPDDNTHLPCDELPTWPMSGCAEMALPIGFGTPMGVPVVEEIAVHG